MTAVISPPGPRGDPARMEASRPAADPFLEFRRDHARVLDRLARLESQMPVPGAPVDEAPLRELVAHLERQFSTHMVAEDRVLYPALRTAFPEVGGTLDPLAADHAELRELLGALGDLLGRPPGRARDEQLVVLARDFSDLLRLHIHREESVVFDVAARVLSRVEIAALAAGLESFRNPDPNPGAPGGR